MNYKLPQILRERLEELSLSSQDIDNLIVLNETLGKAYLKMRFQSFYEKLTTEQIQIMLNMYIQYQLFSYVELDEIVKDKIERLEHIIDETLEIFTYEKKNEKLKQSSENIGRIMVL